MPKGGPGRGQGRKKGSKSLASEAYRQFLIKEVSKEKGPIVAALIEKAKRGDVLALREINDRVLGRATEHVDLTSGGNPIPLLGNARKLK